MNMECRLCDGTVIGLEKLARSCLLRKAYTIKEVLIVIFVNKIIKKARYIHHVCPSVFM